MGAGMEVAARQPEAQGMTGIPFRVWATGGLYLAAALHGNAEDRNPADTPALTVRLLNLAGVDPAELDRATGEALWILGKAGVGVRWLNCPAEIRDAAEAGPCGERGDGLTFSLGVVAKAPEFLRGTGLGFALVHTGQRNSAGVVYPRIVELARTYPLIVKSDQVLAYAMVHEIGHLILGSTAHRPSGILRAGCRPAELEALSQRRLLFGAAEVEAMHRKMRERRRREER